MKYRIDPSRISFEHIQDETIVIDFETGAYFSIGGIGCDIWEKIVEGLDTSAILQSARSTFDAADSEVEEGILHFLEALEREELIAGTGESARSDPEVQKPPATNKREFIRPTLEKYTDMKDLLLLDPIHEVDDRGWPIRKPGP